MVWFASIGVLLTEPHPAAATASHHNKRILLVRAERPPGVKRRRADYAARNKPMRTASQYAANEPSPAYMRARSSGPRSRLRALRRFT